MTDSSQLPSTLAIATTALTAATLSGASLWAYSVFMPRCQFWAPVIRSLPQRDAVALTFDDGPHPEFTPQILDILEQQGARASFFIIGRFAKQHPELLRSIASRGHTIGNHSLDHARYGVNQSVAYWRNQINETQKIISDIIGQIPLLFRPPMGFKTHAIATAAREARLPIVGWSLRTYDSRPLPSHKIADRVLKQVAGHDIVLLHDGIEPARINASQAATVAALPSILVGIATKDLRAVTLLESLATASTPVEPHSVGATP